MMPDYVYYLVVNDEVMYEKVFESEAEAIEFAEVNEIADYEVLEWNVD